MAADTGVNGDVQGFMLFGTRILTEAGPGKGDLEEEAAKAATDAPEKRNAEAATDSPEKRNAESAAVLPCPRCKSTETKFCYFNNYNVNQPRHFCKGCQRYWTAGGTLRNVPVGAGRRKARPSSREESVLEFSSGLVKDGAVVEQWPLSRPDLPMKRPNNSLTGRIR